MRFILFSIVFHLLSLLLHAQVKVLGKHIDSFQVRKKIVIADTIRFSDERPPTIKIKNTKKSILKAVDSTKAIKNLVKVPNLYKVKVDSTKIKKPVLPAKVKAVDSTKAIKTLVKVPNLYKVKVDSTKIKKPAGLDLKSSPKEPRILNPKPTIDSTKIKKVVLPAKAKAVDSTKAIKTLVKVDSAKIKKPVVQAKVKAIDSTKAVKNLVKVDSAKIKKPAGLDLKSSPKEPRILNPKPTIDSTKIKKAVVPAKVIDSTKTPKIVIFKREATQLKIISYNIRHGIGNDGKINLLKLVDLIKKHQPDVVALQEIDSGMVRSGKLFQARILSLLTGYDEVYGKAVETAEGNYGLAILTKHSYQDFQNIELPSPEATEPRNMLSVVITLPNSRLVRFCNTQLDYKSPLNRGIQAALISKNLGFGLYPTVLCGNFNAAINDHTVDFLPKYWNNAGQFDDSPTHIPTDRRIDYCWTTKGNDFKLCEYRVLKEVKMSDHYPILIVYELSK